MSESDTKISLAGKWRFKLDPDHRGIDDGWFGDELPDEIALPGSTDDGGYGSENSRRELIYLTRVRTFEGRAWYQKTIDIPKNWAGKQISLFLERCMWETDLWIDDTHVGWKDSLLTPHTYDISEQAEPGSHRLTLLVDSSPRGTPKKFKNHAYGEHTQIVWNGIIGRVELSCLELMHLVDVQVFPKVSEKSIRVESRIGKNPGGVARGNLTCTATLRNAPDKPLISSRQSFEVGGIHDPVIVTELSLGPDALLWDDFSPNLYDLEVVLEDDSPEPTRDCRNVTFGLWEIEVRGTQFLLNGRVLFLRGTHDAGNAPLKGYPDTDVESWRRIYRIGKSYGLNHWRFHSWTPPEAAFTAADEEGIILQSEMVHFAEIGKTFPPRTAFDDKWRREEMYRVLSTYGNHPSFCMMTMGNELTNDPVGAGMISEARASDPRRIYSVVSNDFDVKRPYDGDQFWVTPFGRDGIENRGKRFFFTELPNTEGDYTDLFEQYTVPIITHELGQWWVYPNLDEIPKYNGNLRARHFEIYRESLERRGMLDKAKEFVAASGALSAIMYREEIEHVLRTPSYGGFQLLDIHDYPGQGTATVGILDSFWESKGLIAPEAWRKFCQPVVLLARFPRYVWKEGEDFVANIEVTNYGESTIKSAAVTWIIKDSSGKEVVSGKLPSLDAPQGQLTSLGQVKGTLTGISAPQKLSFELSLDKSSVANDWPLWVFPSSLEMPASSNVIVTNKWNIAIRRALYDGATVVLFARPLMNAEPTRFATMFWSPYWVSEQPMSCGLLIDKTHPALSHFPTETHTNWHWWELLSIVEEVSSTERELYHGSGPLSPARAAVLNDFPPELQPIVQVIDQPLRNNREAVIFEASAGKGRLLVCTLDVETDLDQRFVARQLRYSLLKYVESEQFKPAVSIYPEMMEFIFSPR